jgi:pimeloyl-ACP methyl ester carboxylesterase
MVRRVLKWAGLVVLGLVLLVFAISLWPASTAGLASAPRPVLSYAEAMADLEQIRADERRDGVFPDCVTRVMTHGAKTERSIALVHGLTNCPAQWALFGQELFARGWNVLILRLPEHGLASPDGTIGPVSNLEHLSARKLARSADRAVDLARGLGVHTDVMGLSLGGTVAAWMAQERSDVDRAVVIAPGIGIPKLPYAMTWGITNLFDHLPDLSIGDEGKLTHEYQGWSTGGIADTFVLGKYVRRHAGKESAAAASITVLLNPNDDTISNPLAEDLVRRWRDRGHPVRLVWLPDRPKLEHDVIDPGQPWARPGFVYPRLMRLLDAPRTAPSAGP